MKATWNGTVIAESDDTVLVEGNHYFPESSLNRDVVTFSNHRTSCPWKGEATITRCWSTESSTPMRSGTTPNPSPRPKTSADAWPSGKASRSAPERKP